MLIFIAVCAKADGDSAAAQRSPSVRSKRHTRIVVSLVRQRERRSTGGARSADSKEARTPCIGKGYRDRPPPARHGRARYEIIDRRWVLPLLPAPLHARSCRPRSTRI